MRVWNADPVKRTLDLFSIRCIPSPGKRVIDASNLDDLSGCIFLKSGAPEDICVLKTHLGPWRKPEKLLWWLLHEIILFNEQLSSKGDLSESCLFRLRVIQSIKLFKFPFRIVLYYKLKWSYYSHYPLGRNVEFFPYAVVKELYIHKTVGF